MKKFKIILFSLTFSLSFNTHAQPGVWFEVPIYDYPFNQSTSFGLDYFSMRQSTALSTGIAQTAHRAIGGDSKKGTSWWRFLLIGGFDYFTSTFPGGTGWAHEEWHRAAMTRRGIKSYNTMNDFPIGGDVISVNDVKDEDLIMLKAQHPAELVRLSAAGMEAQIYQNKVIQKSHFFRDARSQDTFLLWYNSLNVVSYMLDCASDDSNKITREEETDEGTNLKKRDFTGLDCNAWVNDLFRPDEAYTARGTHPSGVGIRRYIRYSDLNSREQRFLRKQSKFAYLNFVDPFLFGVQEMRSSFGRWNFNFSHYLTSFGSTVDANLFLDVNKHKFLITMHNGMSPKSYFPGLSLQYVDAQIGPSLFVNLGGTVWAQPKNQRYDTNDIRPLLDGNIEIALRPSNRLEFYLGYEAKTAGWKAGNVYLDNNWSTWTGVRIGLY